MELEDKWYRATIPPEQVTAAGLEWFIKVFDDAKPTNIIYYGLYGNNLTTPNSDSDININIIPLPYIIDYRPKSSNVKVNSSIIIEFNTEMDPACTEKAFSISPPVRGTIRWTRNKMIFTPDSNFDYNRNYTVAVLQTSRCVEGRYLVNDYEWTFTTEQESKSDNLIFGSDQSIIIVSGIILVIILIICIIIVITRKNKTSKKKLNKGGIKINGQKNMIHNEEILKEIDEQIKPILPREEKSAYSTPIAPQPKSIFDSRNGPKTNYQQTSGTSTLIQTQLPMNIPRGQPQLPTQQIPQSSIVQYGSNLTNIPDQHVWSRICQYCGTNVLGPNACPRCGKYDY
jgi:hypothetical protein